MQAGVQQALAASRTPVEALARILQVVRDETSGRAVSPDERRLLRSEVAQRTSEMLSATRTWATSADLLTLYFVDACGRLSPLLATRVVSLILDRAFANTFSLDLHRYYADHASDRVSRPDVYLLRSGDPVAVNPMRTEVANASRHGWDRTEHLVLAPTAVDNCRVELSFELSTLVKPLLDDDSLTVAIAQPVRHAKDWTLVRRFDKPPAPSSDPKATDRAIRMVRHGHRRGAEFILFPEGTVTQQTIRKISLHASRGNTSPTVLCIPGSSYVPTEHSDLYRNEAEIIVMATSPTVSRGSRVPAAVKNRRSFDDLEPIEDRSRDPLIRIFALGQRKLSVVICADFRESLISHVLRSLWVEIVFVPTLTRRGISHDPATDFIDTARQYARDVGAIVAVANTSFPGQNCYVAGAVESPERSHVFAGRSRRKHHLVGVGVGNSHDSPPSWRNWPAGRSA